MSGYNRVVVMGNLTRDPEQRSIGSDNSVTTMGLAINEHYRGRDGKDAERVCFIDVEVWGKRGDACAEYLAKGAPALVEGKLLLDQWENKDGESRSKIKIRADQVRFVGKPQGNGSSSGRGSRRYEDEHEHA